MREKASPVIAISGKSGCGNTTVSTILAKKLERRLVNYTFRNMAQEMGMELAELLELAKKDTSWDRKLDIEQVKIAHEEPSVIGSRLAIWLLRDAELSVYLYASAAVRAGRIHKREGGSYQELLDATIIRDEDDHLRYLNLYGIDNDAYQFADLIINVESMEPERITEIIISALPENRRYQ